MKKLFALCLVLMVFACSKSDDLSTVNLEEFLGVSATVSPWVEREDFLKIFPMEQERQQLDLLMPNSGSPSGIVLFFHGGGFTAGDKTQAFDPLLRETMQAVLDNNIAIVSANYTLLTTPGNQGVISALEDGTAVINFIQERQTQLNIPANKIVLAGTSAGAELPSGTALKMILTLKFKG